MTISDRKLEWLQQTYEKARAAHSEAKEAHLSAVQQRDEIERRAEEAEAQIERLQEEAEADSLLAEPGGGTAVASGTREKLQRLKGEKAELSTRIETRRKAREQAQERARRAALELTRAIRERRQRAAVQYRQSFEPLGEAVIEHYLEHLAAKDRLTALDRELSHMAGQATTSPQQLSRLRASIKRGDRDLSGSALLGWCVVEAVRWARRFDDGPLGEFLREEGVPAIDGSPRHGNPFGALEGIVAAIEQARLPGGSTRI